MNKPDINLSHFISAHQDNFDQALSEIRSGIKTSHWMWYIFPQWKGLGRSSTAAYYAIKSKEEAIAFFNHEYLGKNLKQITQAFLDIEGKSAHQILGAPDDLKMKSCMSLFHLIQNETDLFKKVLDKYYDGKVSYRTKELLEKETRND